MRRCFINVWLSGVNGGNRRQFVSFPLLLTSDVPRNLFYVSYLPLDYH